MIISQYEVKNSQSVAKFTVYHRCYLAEKPTASTESLAAPSAAASSLSIALSSAHTNRSTTCIKQCKLSLLPSLEWKMRAIKSRLAGAVVCLHTAHCSVQATDDHMFATELQYQQLMPISCHLWDCTVVSLTHVHKTIVPNQTFTFYILYIQKMSDKQTDKQNDSFHAKKHAT